MCGMKALLGLICGRKKPCRPNVVAAMWAWGARFNDLHCFDIQVWALVPPLFFKLTVLYLMFVLLSFNVLSSCPVEFQSNEPWVFDIWLILGSFKVLDKIQLVVTVVVCFASLSHFYLRKPSGQGVAWSLCPKRPSWAELPHSCDGRKAADVDLWGRPSWPQSQNQEIVCAGACGARCVGQSQWEDQSLCLPWLLRSGCAQVLRARVVTMICTTLTSRTCFYFLGWWCFRRATLDFRSILSTPQRIQLVDGYAPAFWHQLFLEIPRCLTNFRVCYCNLFL